MTRRWVMKERKRSERREEKERKKETKNESKKKRNRRERKMLVFWSKNCLTYAHFATYYVP